MNSSNKKKKRNILKEEKSQMHLDIYCTMSQNRGKKLETIFKIREQLSVL